MSANVIGGLLALACTAFWFDNVQFEAATAVVYEFSWVKWLAVKLVLALWAASLLTGVVSVEHDLKAGRVDLLVLALAAWFAVSLAWSPDFKSGLLSISHLAAAVSAYLLTRLSSAPALKELVSSFAILGMVSTLLLGAFTDDSVVGNGLGNENWGAEFMVLCLSAGLSVSLGRGGWRSQLTVALSAATTLYIVVVAPSHLALVGLWFVVIYAARAAGWRTLFRSLVAATILAAIAAVTVSIANNEVLPKNVRDRLQTWGSVVTMIGDAPVIGRGVGGYLHDGGAYVNEYQAAFSFLGPPAYNNLGRQTDAAENELLHVLVEYGLVGASGCLLLLWTLLAPSFFGRGFPVRARWLPLPILAVLGVGLVSFPLQNAATLIPLVICAGVLASYLGVREVTLRPLAGAAVCIVAVGLSAWGVVSGSTQVRASWYAAIAAAADKANEPERGAILALRAANVADEQPFVRLRSYTQVTIAGPAAWAKLGMTSADLDSLYERARTASPWNPLLLDLRLKTLLSRRGQEIEINEIEAMIGMLKKTTGNSMANAHVLEAAFAIQVGQVERARNALHTARALISDPPSDEFEATNLENIKALERSIP